MTFSTINELKKWINENIVNLYFPGFIYEKTAGNDAIVFSSNSDNIKYNFGLGLEKFRTNKTFKISGIFFRTRLNNFENFYAKEKKIYFHKDLQNISEVYTITNKFPNEIWPLNDSIEFVNEEAKELLIKKVKEHSQVYGYIFTKYNTLYDLHAECNNFGNDLSLYNSYGEHFKHIYIKYFCEDKFYKRFAELVIEKKNKSISRYPIDSTDINMLGWKREVVAIEDLLQRIERGELAHLVGTF